VCIALGVCERLGVAEKLAQHLPDMILVPLPLGDRVPDGDSVRAQIDLGVDITKWRVIVTDTAMPAVEETC
jgi:hypothetical protein